MNRIFKNLANYHYFIQQRCMTVTETWGLMWITCPMRYLISVILSTCYVLITHCLFTFLSLCIHQELLALEDHMGYANTGLSEEEVLESLKHTKYFLFGEENASKECCSICQVFYHSLCSLKQRKKNGRVILSVLSTMET